MINNINMGQLLDEYYALTEEELNYKNLWANGVNSVEHICLPEEVQDYARLSEKIVLRPKYYLKADEQKIKILKHPVWMPRYLHSHEYIEITYIVSGFVEESIESIPITLNKGELIILSPGIYHNIWTEDEGTLALNFVVNRDYFVFLDNKYGLGHAGNQYTVWTCPLSDMLLEALLEENKSEDPTSMFMLEALFSQLLLHLKRSGKPVKAAGYSTRKEIFEIISYIEENFRTITLSSFAEHYEITEQYASKLLREKLGVNFSTFLKKLKMEEAARLLETSNKSAKEICYLIGYSSPEHFSRTFKAYYKTTPDCWRKGHSK